MSAKNLMPINTLHTFKTTNTLHLNGWGIEYNNVHVIITDPPSITTITVEDTGTTFTTISWISTSVGSVTYTITCSTGDVMISSNDTIDTNYTINRLTSGTLYRISVVPSVGMCEGEGKEIMVNTIDVPSEPISDGTTTGKSIMKIVYKTPAIGRWWWCS